MVLNWVFSDTNLGANARAGGRGCIRLLCLHVQMSRAILMSCLLSRRVLLAHRIVSCYELLLV